jgi:chromosome segregation ATPase
MLKMLEAKTEEEGKKAQVIFDKYMCYCKETKLQLEAQIAAANEKLPLLEASLKTSTASHTQLTEDLKQHKTDRSDAKEAVETATALREKAAATFASESSNMKANIQALGKAITAITKGMGGAFLQTPSSTIVRKLSLSMNMGGADREVLSSFLATSDGSSNSAEKSGEINGILKQMKDEMEKDLSEMVADENKDIANFESLVAAKQKEISATTKDIEEKTGRVGDLAVEIATLKGDLEDTQEALAGDKEFAANLGVTCENKKVKFAEYTETVSEEKVALADTIKLLNDDDALELFKKTLPSPGASLEQQSDQGELLDFLQVASAPNGHQNKVRRKAAAELQKKKKGDRRISMLVMALRGQKAGFAAVTKKVDELIGVLNQEQSDDDAKKEFCLAEIDKTEDEQKDNERAISDRKTIIAETADTLTALKAEIAKLVAGVKQLDAEVAEQTQLRKDKHASVVETLAAKNPATTRLEVAQKRLNKFYNPSMGKGAVLISKNTAEVGLVQVQAGSALAEEQKIAKSGSVIQMLDLLRGDLSKEIAALEAQDAEAQKDYEQFVKDSSAKRKTDSKAVADKEGSQASLEETLTNEHEALRGEETELMQTKQELAGLHSDCDWLLANYDLRKNARAEEADSLEKAKAVLAGADYS